MRSVPRRRASDGYLIEMLSTGLAKLAGGGQPSPTPRGQGIDDERIHKKISYTVGL